jgi:hypothetical protein
MSDWKRTLYQKGWLDVVDDEAIRTGVKDLFRAEKLVHFGRLSFGHWAPLLAARRHSQLRHWTTRLNDCDGGNL